MGVFFFQAEDGIRDLVRSRGLGDVYKRQGLIFGLQEALLMMREEGLDAIHARHRRVGDFTRQGVRDLGCLLYTSDAADERSSVDLGGRRIIKKNTQQQHNTHNTISDKKPKQQLTN